MVTIVRLRRKPRSLGSSFLGSFHYRLGRTHKMAEESLSQRSTKNRRRQVPAVLVEGIINMYTVDPHSSIRSCTTRPRPPPLDYRTTFGPRRRQFNPSLVIDRVPSELLVSGELDYRSIYLFNVCFFSTFILPCTARRSSLISPLTAILILLPPQSVLPLFQAGIDLSAVRREIIMSGR